MGSMEPESCMGYQKFDTDFLIVSGERIDLRFERVELQFDLRNDLTKLCVSNNKMYILTSSLVYRINLDNPSEVTSVFVPSIPDKVKITRSWLHPNGEYLIVQVNKTNYFILHLTYAKFKILPKFKGLDIQSIAFDTLPNEHTTGDFLFVTADGSVYVALLKHHDPTTQENKRDDKYAKQLFNAKAPATGICYSQRYRQIHLFLETKMLVWDCVEFNLAEISRSLRQVPLSKDIPDGADGALILALPDCFYYFIPETSEFTSNDEEALLSNVSKIPSDGLRISNLEYSTFMTSHHFRHLTKNNLLLFVIDKLMSQDPLVRSLPQLAVGEVVLGLAVDYSAGTYWLYTSNSIYEILFSSEASSVWYSYYKMGNYNKALEVLDSATETPKTWFKKNVVLVKQGYDYLQRGGFGIDIEDTPDDTVRFDLQKLGIRKLAELQEPFEKVCLLLMNNNDQSVAFGILSNKLLLEYLTIKFNNAKISRNKIQQVALSSWIVKLYLRLLYVIHHNFLEDSECLPQLTAKEMKECWQKEFKEIESSMSNFLATNHKSLDQKTVYQLMKELKFYTKLITFAKLLQDYEFIVDYNIDSEDWPAALKAVANLYATEPKRGKAVVYKTSETLLTKFPKQTVETWLRFPELDHEMLLPAILSYNKTGPIEFSQNHALQFLQRLIFDKSVKSTNLNNCYLSLVISYPQEEDEGQIEKALTKALEYFQHTDLGFKKRHAYDKNLLVRLCLRFKRYKGAVLILINDMELHEVALKLALEHGLTSLGEFILKSYDDFTLDDQDSSKNDFIIESNSAEDSTLLSKIKLENDSFASRRKLWLIYARYVVERVCNGETLDIPGLQVEAINTSVVKNGGTKGTAKEREQSKMRQITSELFEEDTEVDDKAEVQNSRLNRALQYLLHLAYSCDGSSNVLTLKDLLLLFPDSIKIIHFREEIVESLNLYNTKINQLGLEMQESALTAKKLKNQIQQNQKKEIKGAISTIIEPGEHCQICCKLLVEKNFILFPNCHHGFHKDCTVRFYLQLKGDYRFKKIFQSFKQSLSLDKSELDKLLLSECLLCNDSLLNKIEDPLIDVESEREEWAL